MFLIYTRIHAKLVLGRSRILNIFIALWIHSYFYRYGGRRVVLVIIIKRRASHVEEDMPMRAGEVEEDMPIRAGQVEEDISMASSTQHQHQQSGGRSRKRRRNICLLVTAIMMTVGLILLILGLTVFKVKRPTMTFNSIALRNLDYSIDTARLRVLFNVTLEMTISIHNPNMVGFKYTNSTTFLRYRGDDVGEVPVIAGRIGAHDRRSLNITLTMMADRLLSNSTLYSDVISGSVPFQIYIRLPGKVRVLFFNIHVVIYITCDLDIDLNERNLSNSSCRYKTKL